MKGLDTMLNYDELDVVRVITNDDPEMSREEVIRTMEDMLSDDELPEIIDDALQYDVIVSALGELRAMSDADFAALDLSVIDDDFDVDEL